MSNETNFGESMPLSADSQTESLNLFTSGVVLEKQSSDSKVKEKILTNLGKMRLDKEQEVGKLKAIVATLSQGGEEEARDEVAGMKSVIELLRQICGDHLENREFKHSLLNLIREAERTAEQQGENL